MSRLTWMNASPFLETLLDRILFTSSNLYRQGTLSIKIRKVYFIEKRMAPEIASSGAFY